MNSNTKEGLYFLPLGGADEIGMNMYAYGCNGKWIVVDAGYGFLNDDYPGMDMCYASAEFLEQFSGCVEGLFITHGHEDHMGAIAHIWPSLQCPVYATNFACKLMEARLREYGMENIVPLHVVRAGDNIKTENFSVDFVALVHSIPETCGLFIGTPYGSVFHATDWRFDDGATAILPTDYTGLQAVGNRGVTMFVCDSTNIMVEKQLPSEAVIRQNLMDIIPQIKGELIVTCFASNLARLESVILAGQKAGRTPILVGKSLVSNVNMARECGYFGELPATYTPEQAKGITSDKALYICTGSQANYRSALSLIAKGESKYLTLSANDTIIFSSKIIPGNEKKIECMQEKMRDCGVTVLTEEDNPVHTSGHCSKEELKKMYEILKPQIVFPVHGDKRFIREHKRFALSCGIPQVCSAQNGDLFLLQNGQIHKAEEVISDIIGIDRGRQVSLNSELIRKRKQIAYNCTLFISIVISKDNKVKDLQISSEDILEHHDWQNLATTIQKEAIPLIEKKLSENGGLTNTAMDYSRALIRRRVFSATNIKPVTLMHFYQEQ